MLELRISVLIELNWRCTPICLSLNLPAMIYIKIRSTFPVDIKKVFVCIAR
jgi:hypothetical protein